MSGAARGAGAAQRAASAARPLRAWLRRTFGIWVLHEARNRVLGWPRALEGGIRERIEVRRLGKEHVIPPSTVTTIIPTFRRPDAALLAVRSALAQTLASHTVIVVDDGGGLPDLPEDPRLVAVSLRRNTGRPGVVRNVGIALARSPYIAFLDDDNQWYPGHLATALAAMEEGADLVYTAVSRVLPDGTELDVLSRPFDRRALGDSAFVDTNSVVVRRGSGVHFSRLRRTRTTLPGEDWEFVWRLSRRLRTVHVPTTTVRYVANPHSYFSQWSGVARPTGNGDRAVPDAGQ